MSPMDSAFRNSGDFVATVTTDAIAPGRSGSAPAVGRVDAPPVIEPGGNEMDELQHPRTTQASSGTTQREEEKMFRQQLVRDERFRRTLIVVSCLFLLSALTVGIAASRSVLVPTFMFVGIVLAFWYAARTTHATHKDSNRFW